jgi:hypothetical protein
MQHNSSATKYNVQTFLQKLIVAQLDKKIVPVCNLKVSFCHLYTLYNKNFLSPITEVMQPYSWRHNSSYS